ncbi:MAG TPA: hypothetical protein ENH45_03240, partial [Nitrospirae bacterium]|nr:hypothetical protein [Nitrospirota bacterium]
SLWLPFYETEYGQVSHDVLIALYGISAATIDRLLKPARIKYKGRGRSTTKPGTLLKKHIPIKNLWGQIFDLDKTVTMKDLTPKTGI